jgi:Na+-driven multidrug efflux pump
MSSLILRVSMSYGLAHKLGPDVIAIAEISAWVFAALLCFLRYKSNKWQRII